MKKKFILEIEVDEKNIVKKYPNYQFNFTSSEEFISHLINNIIYEADINMSKDGLKKWGYSIKIRKEK